MKLFGTVLPYIKFSTYILDEEEDYDAIELKMVEVGWLGHRYGFIYSAKELEA